MQIQLSGKKFIFARVCACCGAPSDSEIQASASKTTGKRVVRTKTNTWNFPYCSACLAHVKAWDAAGVGTLIVLSLIGGASAALVHPLLGVLVAGAAIAISIRTSNGRKRAARAMCSSGCASAERAVHYLGWSGTVETFDIRSTEYARRFVRDNRQKLINASQAVLALLDAAAHVATDEPIRVRVVETPRGVAPPDVFIEWIKKVEGLKGPATRRATTALALGDPALAQRRDEFIRAAAQIEVRATLDKIDSLKTVAAKRRHLVDAINALRSDSASDELQAAEIQALESALARVEAM